MNIELDIPYLSGTGFFVYFPPFEDQFFYITSDHCIDYKNCELILKVSYGSYKNQQFFDLGDVEFDCPFTVKRATDDEDYEDVLIFPVNNISDSKKEILFNRALRLSHDDDVSYLLNLLSSSRDCGKVRIIGYPACSETELEYDKEKKHIELKMHPRGLNGYLEKDEFGYKIINTNWRDERLGGFSGSPVLCLINSIKEYNIIILGLVSAGSNSKKFIRFIPIDLVTQGIAQFLYNKGYNVQQA